MAKCEICGNDAGLFRKKHRECEVLHATGLSQAAALITQAIGSPETRNDLVTRLSSIAATSFISPEKVSGLVVEGWERAVANALDDDLLTEEEERNLSEIVTMTGLTREQLDRSGAYSKIVKAGIIRDLLADKVPTRAKIEGQLPFNLHKGETIVWVFLHVPYYELRTTTTYTGSYQGVSLRVARGVYYRTGGFRGNPTPVTRVVKVDEGMFAVTNKHLYYAGPAKSFRIPYSKVVSFTPYDDGIGLCKDAATAKPQALVTGDGWFTYNLVTNLARIAAI